MPDLPQQTEDSVLSTAIVQARKSSYVASRYHSGYKEKGYHICSSVVSFQTTSYFGIF